VVDGLIDELDPGPLGLMASTVPSPAYRPAGLLKIYLYSYLNVFNPVGALSVRRNATLHFCDWLVAFKTLLPISPKTTAQPFVASNLSLRWYASNLSSTQIVTTVVRFAPAVSRFLVKG
jgi:hypothetical protein